MARTSTNPDFLRCKEERNEESFFKVVQSGDMSSENMRAIPYDFARRFSDKELSHKMKIKAQWGSSWEVGISKNPRFYFMEKSGWEKFVRDNALGDHEFLTFIHKGEMRFAVNIFKKDGKEMIQPPQSRDFHASSSRIKTEQDVKIDEEVVVPVPSELSSPGAAKTSAESNGGGKYKKKLNSGKSKAAKSQNSKRTEKMFSKRRDSAGASSSSPGGFNIFISKSYLKCLGIPRSVANDYYPRKRTVFKIHHPDGHKSWDVVYSPKKPQSFFSCGWRRLCREYPLGVGDTCRFTVIKPHELLLVVLREDTD